MTFQPQHRLLLAAGALLVLSAGAFAALTWRANRATRVTPAPVALAEGDYTAVFAEAAPLPPAAWAPPPAQTRGREWVYDTFTPPEIFYHARTRQFSVKPPAGFGDDEPAEPFGLELVAVRPEPFRLQLVGYVGGEGNWRGMFEDVVSGEVVLASAGRRLPKLGLAIERLEVRAQPVAFADSMTTRQRVATAVVRDERTGNEIALTHRERTFTRTLSALVAAEGETAAREVRVGETFKAGLATYRIERIELTPPAVEVTKESPTLAQPERRTLAPREADEPEPAEKANNS